jgi:transposase InsO family protein
MQNQRIYPKVGVRKLKDFTATEADNFFEELGRVLSKCTLVMIKSTLRRSIRRAQVHNLIARNVVELIDLPSGQPGRPSRTMTQAQASKVLKAAGGQASGFRTTVPGKDGQQAPDLLGRDFTAPAPNRRWVADFTYVAAWSGTVYVSFVVDIYSRAVVGWSAAAHKRAKLVLDALQVALWRRDRDGRPAGPGLVQGIPPAEYEAAPYAQTQPPTKTGPST